MIGIDPANEGISFYRDFEITGETLTGAEDGRLLIGKALVETLQTKVGRRVVTIVEGADGKSLERGYRIAGVFDSPMGGLRICWCSQGLEALQGAMGADQLADPITELSVVLQSDEDRPPAVKQQARQLPKLVVTDWQQMQPQILEMVDLVDATMVDWFLLIMGASFGLVFASSTSSRTRELGMLRALGMTQKLLLIQVVMECVGIMIVGVVAGLLLGSIPGARPRRWYWLSAFSESVEANGMSASTGAITLEDLLLFGDLSVLAWTVRQLFPARRALKISPLMAMNR